MCDIESRSSIFDTGFGRNSTSRSGEYLEGMVIQDYVGSKNNKVMKSQRSGAPAKLVTALTCLQFFFAVYATFLLYYMGPSIDLRTSKPDFTWATRIANQWKQYMITPHVVGHYQEAASSLIREDNNNNNHNMNILVPPHQQEQPLNQSQVCEYEKIDFMQKKSNDVQMRKLKRELYDEVLEFQSRSIGTETLPQLMAMKSKWDIKGSRNQKPKITVLLNHFKRKTLCAQIDSLLQQTLPFHHAWVLSFGSPNELSLKRIVESYNDSRISFISSSYDFKYYGRFQMALQTESDLVYIVDDDMIPGKKMLEILAHVAGTEKYKNSVLGSIGRILPFRQKDFTFPSYRKFRSKEAGLYLPDPAYDITVDKIVQVDFLSSSWFLSAELVKTLFIETPFTFSTGEDLHLSYQLQKYQNAGSFVVPVDPNDKETWGDSEHRLAYVSETTVIFKDIVQVRDDQWWKALSTGYVTQWAAMYPQNIDALFYAHTLDHVKALQPLLDKFRSTMGKKAYIVVSGGKFCPCEDAARALKWPLLVCKERRFKIFDLGIEAISGVSDSEVPVIQAVYSSMKGLIKIHNPSVVITLDDIDPHVRKALKMASESTSNATTLVLLPRASVPKVLWMPDLRSTALPNWNKMRLSINIITQNRVTSLTRLLKSLSNAYYLGDEIPITFNMDSKVDEATIKLVGSFEWPHGPKTLRRRIIQGGLIRAVSESWYPSNDDDFGLLLEDDIEVSPYYYLWIKYALLAYHYDPQVSLPELSSISLYTPRIVEVVKERPKWNATEFFKKIHPNTPYLHQLPCSWGAVFFPKHWREFYVYMNMRFTEDAKTNPVQIPRSRTNGRQRRGEDVVHPLKVSLEDLYLGTSKKLSLSRNVLCSKCNGKGSKSGASMTCAGCQGTGMKVSIRHLGPSMIQQMQHPCNECKGTGETINEKDRCPQCKGEKVVQEKKVLEVHVEKGMQNGQKITFPGEADEAPDTVTGDIVFVLQQKEHPKFKRRDEDLFVEHSLSLTEALCGFKFVLTHLDGRQLLIKSNPGEVIKPDSYKAINDEGMPMYQRPFMKGKLYIHFSVEFPESLIPDQVKALEAVLPPKPTSQLTDMELDECEETTLHDVNMEEEMRRRQQAQQEAYDEDDDMHGGHQRVQCAQQ